MKKILSPSEGQIEHAFARFGLTREQIYRRALIIVGEVGLPNWPSMSVPLKLPEHRMSEAADQVVVNLDGCHDNELLALTQKPMTLGAILRAECSPLSERTVVVLSKQLGPTHKNVDITGLTRGNFYAINNIPYAGRAALFEVLTLRAIVEATGNFESYFEKVKHETLIKEARKLMKYGRFATALEGLVENFKASGKSSEPVTTHRKLVYADRGDRQKVETFVQEITLLRDSGFANTLTLSLATDTSEKNIEAWIKGERTPSRVFANNWKASPVRQKLASQIRRLKQAQAAQDGTSTPK